MKFLVVVAALVWGILLCAPCFAQGPSTEEIQVWLMSPVILYVLMVLGSLVSMFQQWGVAKMSGSSATLGGVFSHVQEILTTLFGNTIAFFLLVENDSLNFISAVSIGYVISSLSDLNPAGSRSTALMKKGE